MAEPREGRLSEGPAPELVRSAFRWEVGLAPILWPGIGPADLAHTTMLIEVGVLPHEIGRRLLEALLAQAEAHVATIMPDYTYLQPAQPTTLAHYLLGFAYPAMRDLERLRAAFQRINRSPAGGGSTNGSRLPLDRHRVAELLRFEGLVTHPRDAM